MTRTPGHRGPRTSNNPCQSGYGSRSCTSSATRESALLTLHLGRAGVVSRKHSAPMPGVSCEILLGTIRRYNLSSRANQQIVSSLFPTETLGSSWRVMTVPKHADGSCRERGTSVETTTETTCQLCIIFPSPSVCVSVHCVFLCFSVFPSPFIFIWIYIPFIFISLKSKSRAKRNHTQFPPQTGSAYDRYSYTSMIDL